MKEALASTLKSGDTEEWLDTVWTRPIGYQWARFFNHFDIHPNTVTILSMVLGVASGILFFHGSLRTEGVEGLLYNIGGVLLLAWANFFDSADGQLARMSGKKTQLGRILDGAAGDVWFIFLYLAIVVRIHFHHDMEFAWLGISDTLPHTIAADAVVTLLCATSGIVFHARQCGLADYYRQIHLFFLKGKAGSELDNSKQQREIYAQTPWKGNLAQKFFLFTYVRYTQAQEQQTPRFQALAARLKERYPNAEAIPQDFRDRFRRHSLPLMKWANILTFNTRALTLYTAFLLDIPWLYPLVELTAFTAIYLYMRHTHETFCKKFYDQL